MVGASLNLRRKNNMANTLRDAMGFCETIRSLADDIDSIVLTADEREDRLIEKIDALEDEVEKLTARIAELEAAE